MCAGTGVSSLAPRGKQCFGSQGPKGLVQTNCWLLFPPNTAARCFFHALCQGEWLAPLPTHQTRKKNEYHSGVALVGKGGGMRRRSLRHLPSGLRGTSRGVGPMQRKISGSKSAKIGCSFPFKVSSHEGQDQTRNVGVHAAGSTLVVASSRLRRRMAGTTHNIERALCAVFQGRLLQPGSCGASIMDTCSKAWFAFVVQPPYL
jgi:hypothetical protein